MMALARLCLLGLILVLPGGQAQQMLANPSFSEASGLAPRHWTPSLAFVQPCGSSPCAGGDTNPALSGGVVRFGRSAQATISQIVAVPIGPSVDAIETRFRVWKPSTPSAQYYAELELRDAAGAVLASRRVPSSGANDASGSWAWVTLRLERDELVSFGAIAQARVLVHGR